MQSRTKEAVDHAGPSLPTLASSSLTGELQENLRTSPSNSLLIAIQHPTAAVVDGTSGLGTISRKLLS